MEKKKKHAVVDQNATHVQMLNPCVSPSVHSATLTNVIENEGIGGSERCKDKK